MGGNLFCQIGDPTKWEANLVIDQDDIEFVREGQTVAIKLDEFPYRTFDTTIAEIGPEMEFASRQLSSKEGGDVMAKADAKGAERPMSVMYQARGRSPIPRATWCRACAAPRRSTPIGSRSADDSGATWCGRSTSSCSDF